VQCLDSLRAIEKQPEEFDTYFAELANAQGADANLDRFIYQ